MERDAGRIVTDADEVRAQGTAAAAAGHTHLMLFKPAGVLTATRDGRETTVLDLIPAPPRGLGPVGRLDKDVTGLILLTTDGQLAHRLISPRAEIGKLYRARVEGTLDEGLRGSLPAGRAARRISRQRAQTFPSKRRAPRW